MLFRLKQYIFRSFNRFYLHHILGVGKVGEGVTYRRGFKVYNGANNIILGNYVSLDDSIFNAGDDDTGTITVGDYSFFGHGTQVIARGHNYLLPSIKRLTTFTQRPITIGKGVWVGSGSIILGGSTIGDHAVIAANSVVKGEVKEWSIYAGNPAILVKKIPH